MRRSIATAIKKIDKERLNLKKSNLLMLLIIMVALIVLMHFVFLFASSYNKLSDAIQQERIDYVSEISDQIINTQQFMEAEYSATVKSLVSVISSFDSITMNELQTYFTDTNGNKLLFMSKGGTIIDLDKNAIFLSDRLLQDAISKSDGEVIQLFSSLNSTDDFWLFASKLNPVSIDGTIYNTVILAVSPEQFRSSLAISLFDNRGASYIINPDGSIAIQPDHESTTFGGYNLLEGMKRAGASDEDIVQLESAFANQLSGSKLIDIKGEQWLISYSLLHEQEERIVVTVPLTITAAETYYGLANTILFAVLTVVVLASAAIFIISLLYKRDKERSKEAMAVAAKSDFFSKISHDIRTPLNAVIGMERLARDNLTDPELAEEYLEKSSAASSYLLSIINDVLDMSRIESGKMTIAHMPFDLNSLIDETDFLVSTMAAERNISFLTVVDSTFDTKYFGDQIRIKQVLMNLLSNSIKFTKPGGKIRLTITHDVNEDGFDNITFTVSDTGIGISEDYLPRIFLPFEQERSSYIAPFAGSGLGLAIVSSLTKAMDGTIAVESKVNVGTTFTVCIKLARCNETADSSEDIENNPVSFAGKRVLLAEDNMVNQQVATVILTKKFNMLVDVANNGKQAVEMFAASAPNHYDIILMDIKMPIMDGLEATRRIRSIKRDDALITPIIALSANAFDEDIALSKKAGMDDYIAKPIDIKLLANALEKYMLTDIQ